MPRPRRLCRHHIAATDHHFRPVLGEEPPPFEHRPVKPGDFCAGLAIADLAIGKEGLAVVDVTEPTAPHLVSRYEIPGEARDLAVQWPYLLVAAGAGGLQVLDIRDPLHLVGVARHQSCDGAYQVVSANGLLYVMQPLGGLWVLRLTGP